VIECVPNFSEGRDRALIDEIAGAVVSSDCRLLDVHSDPDHHRSVLTFVGGESAMVEAALAVAKRAVERIDLNVHRGVHPRIGAIDVIPFVPLRGAAMDDCVRVARCAARAIADELGVPAYLYEAAALRTNRRNLATIRSGGFERLAERMADAEWSPDFGPARPHPTAGAVAVGARRLLVAFNVVLATRDVSVARRIATSLREANGGLPGVKALGVALRTRSAVQVSMNLTDVEATTLLDAFRRVRHEAGRSGVTVIESEIVGLVPRVAAKGATTGSLLLRRELSAAILEDRIEGR
jgi:glutamate formiminotransferase/formiminotetrahydrofolate cyclodeaminase